MVQSSKREEIEKEVIMNPIGALIIAFGRELPGIVRPLPGSWILVLVLGGGGCWLSSSRALGSCVL